MSECRGWRSPNAPGSRRAPSPAPGPKAGRSAPKPKGCRSSIIPMCAACCSRCAPASRRCARSPITPRRCSTAIQVHGGIGYIEESGAAQHLRDARIAPIYEGTNGIQAHDLVARKLARDDGAAVRALIAEMRATADAAAAAPAPDIAATGRALAAAIAALDAATGYLLRTDPAAAAAGSAPYLSLLGTVAGGWLLTRLALAAGRRMEAGTADRDFFATQRAIGRFYAGHMLARAPGYLAAVTDARAVLDFPLEHL